jgi:hypothetical protein
MFHFCICCRWVSLEPRGSCGFLPIAVAALSCCALSGSLCAVDIGGHTLAVAELIQTNVCGWRLEALQCTHARCNIVECYHTHVPCVDTSFVRHSQFAFQGTGSVHVHNADMAMC